jgi:hypothetical protein
MNRRERVGVALHLIAIAILAPFVAWIYWALSHNLAPFTGTELNIIVGSSASMLVVSSILIKGKPVTEVLRRKH